jgi:cytochrome c oxidase cbb3-type subunit 3
MKIASLKKYNALPIVVIIAVICSLPMGAFAAGPPVPSEMSNTLAQMLVVIIAALLLVIVLLANVLIGAAEIYTQRYKEAKKNGIVSDGVKVLTVLFLCLAGSAVFAADAPAAIAAAPAVSSAVEYGGLAATSFYTLISVIGLELIIILGLLYNLRRILAKEVVVSGIEAEAKHAKSFDLGKWWWEKVNSMRPVHEEANIDLGHDYDGIRELDNRLPPWWLYGFYLCILFAVIYLYRFHVAHSAPLSKEEYTISMNEAAAAKEEYLKKAANKVDETNVTYLTDAASLDAGKKIFTTICMACHLSDGGGSVGPNLTDQYWIHGGGIKDIFKTIKYGWPEKGMKSWKDDYSPVQIAQLSSFVKSLQGTKPAKAKEPQGVIYEETAAPAAVAADSAKIADTAKKPAAGAKQ